MSLKKNTAANFTGQLYRTGIGIVMLPVYLQFLGEESYGLVAFFTLLTSWLVLFAAGIAPTLARQVAHARGRGQLGGRPFREMLRSLELLVAGIGFMIILLSFLGSSWIAAHWLTVTTLEISSVSYCIALMGIKIGLTPIVSLYSSGIGGLERQVWLNAFSVTLATLRAAAAYVLLRWVSVDVEHFFELQVAISIFELAIIAWKFYQCQPKGARQHDPGLAFSSSSIRSVLPFILGVAYTSVLWVFITQSDKLVLSHVLTLSEFGYLGIAIMLANSVLLVSGPINRAVLPRLTMHHAQGDSVALLSLYRSSTQFLAVAAFSVGGMLAIFSESVIFALTGNHAASEWGAPVLTWFALGNSLLVIVGMQYNLQFAHGKVRMHVINTTINAVIQVPVLVFVAFNYGAVATAKTWFVIRLATFFVWPTIVHYKFAPGLHWKWVTRDVLPPLVGLVLGLGLVKIFAIYYSTWPEEFSRIQLAAVMLVAGLAVLLLCSFCAKEVRTQGLRLVAGLYGRLVS